MLTPQGMIIKGYKATDIDMKCRDFQFELGKWYEHEGEISLCESGFHFCQYPSGPWCYYGEGRLFEVEAEYVLLSEGPGADLKHVCKRIRLVKEITFDDDKNTGNWNTGNRNTGNWNTGNWNTGNWNTGNWNTGNRNTGNWNTGHGNTGHGNTGEGNTGEGNTGEGNTGDWNTGDWNTGDGNTGHRNTGDGNTGNRNTGNRNTGHGNTGNRNTGNRNTGNRNTGNRNTGEGNTGDWNTGDWNTGEGNTGDFHSGCLNHGAAKFYIFNKQAKRDNVDFYLVSELASKLMQDEEIDPTPFLSLPNATPEAIKKLHEAHKKARNSQ